jgi:hypothetical protein
MKTCPVCRTADIQASHRRGWLERGPLSWVGVLPFRCSSCQTRFYRLALSRRRRHRDDLMVSPPDGARPQRWPLRIGARVTIQQAEGGPLTVDGETENVSAIGVCVRLPMGVPVGSRVSLVLKGGTKQKGSICWSTMLGDSLYSHGIELDRPLERHASAPRALVRFRRRRFLRRLVLGCITLGAIALAAAGLVWLMEAMRSYSPQYYEPKDIERERYETQRQPGVPTPRP